MGEACQPLRWKLHDARQPFEQRAVKHDTLLGFFIVICNIALDIETAGWGLLICGLIAGVGGLAGSKFAGDVYDEATMTELEKALQKLEQQPENVRLLLYAIIT